MKINEGNYTFGYKGLEHERPAMMSTNPNQTVSSWIYTREHIYAREAKHQERISIRACEVRKKKGLDSNLTDKEVLGLKLITPKKHRSMHSEDYGKFTFSNGIIGENILNSRKRSHGRANHSISSTNASFVLRSGSNKPFPLDKTGQLDSINTGSNNVGKRIKGINQNTDGFTTPAKREKVLKGSSEKCLKPGELSTPTPLPPFRLHTYLPDNSPYLIDSLSPLESRKWTRLKSKKIKDYGNISVADPHTEMIKDNLHGMIEINRTQNLDVRISFASQLLTAAIEKKFAKDPHEYNIDQVSKIHIPTDDDNVYQRRKQNEMRHQKMFGHKDDLGILTIHARRELERRGNDKSTVKDDWHPLDSVIKEKIVTDEKTDSNAVRRWKLLKSFLLYIVRQQLGEVIHEFNLCSFFIKPHGITGSENLFASVKTNQMEKVKALIYCNPLYPYCYDSAGKMPIHWAALRGNTQMADVLLKNGCDVRHRDHLGKTPLTYAIESDNIDLVKALLRYGASPFKDGNSYYQKQTENYVILSELSRFRIINAFFVLLPKRTRALLHRRACQIPDFILDSQEMLMARLQSFTRHKATTMKTQGQIDQ